MDTGGCVVVHPPAVRELSDNFPCRKKKTQMQDICVRGFARNQGKALSPPKVIPIPFRFFLPGLFLLFLKFALFRFGQIWREPLQLCPGFP